MGKSSFSTVEQETESDDIEFAEYEEEYAVDTDYYM